METRAHYVLIGAFMLGGIVLGILFTLWLGSNRAEFDEYRIIFTQKISGLQEGANVLFNGIPVGHVESLELDQDNPNRSLAIVRVEEGTPVKSDTSVELELAGITGLAVVQFTGGSPDAPLLMDVSTERIPTIEAELGGIAAVLESSGDLALNLSRLLSQENADIVNRVLEDVESITDVVADKENELGLIIDNFAVMSSEVRKASEQLAGAADHLEATLANIDNIVDTDVRQAVKQVTEAAGSVDALADDLQVLLDDNEDAISDFMHQGLGAAVVTINKASRLMDTIQSILLEFERNPSAFVLGEGRPTAE